MSSPAGVVVPVEILSFAGCPNRQSAVAVVQRAAASLGVVVDVAVVDVPDAETAERVRFLGSPTIRVAGRDVEAGAETRTDFALACRMYRAEEAFRGEPDERWVRDALLRATAGAGGGAA